MEKAPLYMKGPLSDLESRAKNMKRTIPNVKFLVFLCHPVKRLLSWVKQVEGFYEKYYGDRFLAYKELNLTSEC